MKGKQALSVLLAILLFGLAGCGGGGRNPAPDYNWSAGAAKNEEALIFGEINSCGLKLLDGSRMPLSNESPLVLGEEAENYYIFISNSNEVDADCTIFAYCNQSFIPISVDGGEPAEYYAARLAKGESLMLPLSFFPQELSAGQPATFLLGCVLADKNQFEIMRNVTQPVWKVSDVFTVPFQMIAADSAAERRGKTEDVFRGGIRSEYINDGVPPEEKDPSITSGLSFGEKLDNSRLFSISPKVEDTGEIYLRAQGMLGAGKCSAAVFVDNVPVKAFSGKTFAEYSREEMEAYSFLIDPGVFTSGEHTMYGVCFYDDVINAFFTDQQSPDAMAVAYTLHKK